MSDLSKFDDYVFYAEHGGEAFAIGLVVSFFYEDGKSLKKMAARAKLLESFCSFVENNLDMYLPLNTGNPKTDVLPQQILQHFQNQTSEPTTTLGAINSGHRGKDRGRGDPHRFFIEISCGAAKARLSHFIAYLPAGWLNHAGPERFVDKMKEWAGLMGISHGTVGLGCQFSFAISITEGTVFFPYLKRYVGLDMGDVHKWLLEMEREPAKLIRTTNWLTFIDHSLVETLGGRQELQAKLGDTCDLADYGDGLMLRAGPDPEVGDFNEDDIPWRYRAVARALAPIRFEAFKNFGMFEVPPRFNKLNEAKAWVRRFD